MHISLVIPAYNERANLPALLAACDDALAPIEGDHEVLLIDDGSTDGSRELLSELEHRHATLRVLHHRAGQNIGCHPSSLEGFLAARGELMVFLPADLQIRPSVVPAFVQAAGDADVVASYRRRRADPPWRRAVSRLNNRVERLIVRSAVRDAHSAMALTRTAVDAIVPRIVSTSAVIPAEIIARADRLGLRVTEIEIDHHPRTSGTQTGASLRELVLAQADLLQLRRRLTHG